MLHFQEDKQSLKYQKQVPQPHDVGDKNNLCVTPKQKKNHLLSEYTQKIKVKTFSFFFF